MKYSKLTQEEKDIILLEYGSSKSREEVQSTLASHFNVDVRTIRGWAKKMEIGVLTKNIVNPSKILIFDIETSRIPALVWWTGKQYIGHNQLTDEGRIISIAYKWLGDDKISDLVWDDGDDKKMLEKFLAVYNKADMVVGQNNDRFDNRWINARAMKHDLFVNTFVRSFDIMKETKRLFRLPSYSMDYITKFLDAENKMKHEGLIMWDKIQFGTPDEKEEYLKKMVAYNRGDIVSTEDMYLKLRKYMGHKVHFGVLQGGSKHSCPNCGGSDIKLQKVTVTPAGTVQRIMTCNRDKTVFKLANKQYMNFLQEKMNNNIPLNQR